ncbi:IMP dehydrogenase [Sorangium cellulosum]|uniref:IMP dehydrogenase n=1 Tax=Sorangium cellulosum TaxID=56 RepID=A0A2L0EIQ7_SORCE|nr:transglutaminase family protein [Sorangium cellulosum]AUX39176.1 IMP dehydrogenase [Sorangium cellulosum]
MRLLIQHWTHYSYPRPASLGPHLIRLRPATHAKAKIESYSLKIDPPLAVRWQQDPYGNHIARVLLQPGERVPHFDILVELAVDIRPVNPFDFYLDERAEKVPFEYPAELKQDLIPFLDSADPALSRGPLLDEFLAGLPRDGDTVSLLIALNAAVNRRIKYVIREEAGIWTPEETLAQGRGSCRDSAVLLIAALRSRGLAARFVSGYLVQLTDEGMIPDQPRGVSRDVVDLHAWAEVYLPGAGWIGLDATSGLLCGEGHIPLACTASPALAAPVEGTSDVLATDVSFAMKVGRLGHEPRPTTPYEEPVWEELLAVADRADQRLAAAGLTLTMGGEPTFNSREYPDAPEWREGALGPTKWSQGLRLAHELRRRITPGGLLLLRAGKHYPGESLPRWALEIVGRRDGVPLWTEMSDVRHADPGTSRSSASRARGHAQAQRFAGALAARLGLSDFLLPAYEDPWRHLQDEASLPVDADPLKANLDDPEERRRLAKVLDRGLGSDVGYVLPLTRQGGAWVSERWAFRRGHLFLLPGDSAIGLRLPLRSLVAAAAPPPLEELVTPPDPRRGDLDPEEDEKQRRIEAAGGDAGDEGAAAGAKDTSRQGAAGALAAQAQRAAPAAGRSGYGVRTALCVEARDGIVHVFLPPLLAPDDFFELIAAIDATRLDTGVDVLLEGYPPPSGADLFRFSVTPDPGVLEVNLPPTDGVRAYASLLETVFDASLHSGLHCEKYLIDGRMAGSGGGHHLTFGGPTPLASPFLRRPDLLASLLTFNQHHPSLSYMFAGLFVGPTSQAPRVDEARHENLYELEIALSRAFERREGEPPWLTDILFRHLLVDVTGNTHRAEVSIDKLFDPQTAQGRQGIVELRAFEMPPHFRMAVAQMLLVRTLLSAFAESPYSGRLVRWGQALHDRFLLPYYLWRDFEDVLDYLKQRGLALPADAYRPFIELRCPVVGTLHAGDVTLEVRNAIEPWHVLGEELTTTGTSRYVDSSMERIEVRVHGLVPERHLVLVNGHVLPLRPTGTASEFVGGVRFRAWAPPHSLHAHIGIHHPIHLDVLDTWGKRSIGACAYHVWHPEGRAFDTPPLTRFEAAARRAQRFTVEGPMQWPVSAKPAFPHADAPYTLDLRRYAVDRPPPEPRDAGAEG